MRIGNLRMTRQPFLSPRGVVLLCATALAAPLAAAGVVFAEMHAAGGRTADLIRHHLDPAAAAAEHLATVVNGQSATRRGYLLTADASYLGQLDAGTAEAAETFSELNRLATSVPRLNLDLAQLEHELGDWFSAVGPSSIAPAADAPAPVRALAVRASDPEPLRTSSNQLAERITETRDDALADAASHRGGMMIVVTTLTVVLLALVAGMVMLSTRRIVRPLAVLELRLKEAGHGAPGDAPRGQAGWLREVSDEAERLRIRTRELLWAARRDREALTQHGEAAVGVADFLVAHNGPGPGVDADGHLIAAEGLVAGDFWDILALPDGTTALVQGDVSGHGVRAGLASVTVKGRVSTALSLGHRPHEAVRAAWDVLAAEDERFVTLAIAVLDPKAGTLQWANAGHEPPLLRRADGTIERLDATGPLVSSMIDPCDRPWDTARTHLAPGDLLVLATDGLTEARDAQGEEFGADRIERTLRAMTATDPQSAITGLYLAADRHGIDWQRDDVTVLAARVTPGPCPAGQPALPRR